MRPNDPKSLSWAFRRSTALWLIWLFALLGFVLGLHHGTAGIWPLLLFSVASAVATTVVICRPYSPFMLSLVFFFALGFWLKYLFHVIADGEWIEPTGDFSGSRDEWGMVLHVASAAMLATIVPALAARKPGLEPCSLASSRRFALAEPWLWGVLVIGGLLLFGLNYFFEFLRVGIDIRTILPFPLNALLSFLLNAGIAISLACLGYWSWCAGRLPMPMLIAIGIVEGALSGWSTLSRVRIVLHSGAFLMGWAFCSERPGARLQLKAWLALLGVFVLAFVVSTAAVSWERLVLYDVADLENERSHGIDGTPPAIATAPPSEAAGSTEVRREPGGSGPPNSAPPESAPPESAPPESAPPESAPPESAPPESALPESASPESARARHMARQIGSLVIDRWIGLEGVMSVVAYENKGFPLLMLALRESPSAGNDGLFEHMSWSTYRKVPGRTFLTIPGGAAVLYYSGSILLVFLGMMTFCFGGVALERFALKATESPFAMAVIAIAASNSVAQLNHPYSALVLWVQLFTACIAIYIVRRCLMEMEVSVKNPEA